MATLPPQTGSAEVRSGSGRCQKKLDCLPEQEAYRQKKQKHK